MSEKDQLLFFVSIIIEYRDCKSFILLTVMRKNPMQGIPAKEFGCYQIVYLLSGITFRTAD